MIKALISTFAFFSHNILLPSSLKCYSLDNQECKIRPEIINVNNKEPSFYAYKIKMNRCVGSCNTIDDPNGKTFFEFFDIFEYLDQKNCNCRRKMAESLTEKCEKNISET